MVEKLEKKSNTNGIKLGFALLVPMLFLIVVNIMPVINIIGTFSVTEKRMVAIFIMAVFLWILEPIPNYATSLLIIVLELIVLSDKGLIIFRQGDVGQLLHYKDIIKSFAAPIVVLFLGGFTMAHAAKKYRLDYDIARIILKPFGQHPKVLLLGLMSVTALFSMFMSNTATTAMILPILVPVLSGLPLKEKLRGAFVLSIPFAANIGGIGTPVGTPPNAIALRILSPEITISFSQWMIFAVPFVVLLIIVCWLMLIIVFPSKIKTISLDLHNKDFLKEKDEITLKKYKKERIIVYTVIVCTIILWVTDFLHGMNSYVVAMFPVLIFFVLNICTKEDLRIFNWEVLWLVSGGVALGLGLEETGLAARITSMISTGDISFVTLMITSMIIMYIISNFMVHTVASNIVLPILIAVVYSIPSIVAKQVALLIVAVTFASSLGMALPASTPPNALSYATGMIKNRQMALYGLIIGVIGLIGAYHYLTYASYILEYL